MYENGQLVVLNIESILPNRFQPRIRFDEQKLAELAESIRKYGVIQPVVVRQIGNKFEIIAGERRFKASKLANRTSIPAIIVNLSDKDSEEIALLENIQRQELTAIEEAVSYKRILDMGYVTQEALAQKLGKSQSTIANKIRLLNLDDQVQNALLHGKISERHARSLLKLTSNDEQTDMLSRIITERLTVKKTDDEIGKLLSSKPEGQQKGLTEIKPSIQKLDDQVENLVVPPKPVQTVPFASHEIIRVTPPPGVILDKSEEESEKKEERGQGFMDIDKIMKEAQDINVQPQANDITELIKQNETTVMPEPVQTVQESTVEPNKFVNFNGATQEEAPVTVQPTSSVSFDSIFNQKPVGMESQAAVHEEAPQNQPFYANAQAQEIIAPQAEPVVQEITQPQPVISTPVEPSLPEVMPTEPIYQAPVSVQPTISNVPDGNIIEQSQVQEVPVESTTAPLVNQGPTINVAADQSHNFRQVINLIRNCASQIEDLGFYIDVDELDLDDTYQVTFKIDKE